MKQTSPEPSKLAIQVCQIILSHRWDLTGQRPNGFIIAQVVGEVCAMPTFKDEDKLHLARTLQTKYGYPAL